MKPFRRRKPFGVLQEGDLYTLFGLGLQVGGSLYRRALLEGESLREGFFGESPSGGACPSGSFRRREPLGGLLKGEALW